LTQISNPDGSYTCYLYDGLHRLTDVGFSATTGHCKRFRYDNTTGVLGSIPSGVTVSNVFGRLVEAETDTCAGWPSQASIITDEWFSYDGDGRLSDVYEMTQHSGGYYHTSASYWANGQLETLSGIPGLSAWAFTPDGEGRLSSATYGTTNWVTGTTYYPSHASTTVNFGNGDSDVYSYNTNSGRMNKFTFTVGSTPKSLIGVPNWNTNGTLGSLGITDPFNTANTTTCSYTYDDLGRLAGKNSSGYSVDCGTGWQQTITLDAFGNIAKSGTTSFAAGYVNSSTGTTNNQEQQVGSCVPTYDLNGNLTKDCSFATPINYVWDVYGKPSTLNGVGLTYDALDREVENASGSTHRQILYSPIGKIGVMNGQNATTIRVPLPGGSTAVLVGATGGTKQTVHADWLGSARLATTYGNRTMAYDTSYAPYGESYAPSGTATYDLDFTGEFQDTIAGMYDFLYRSYNPVQGRWISPDPAGLSAVDMTSPQSWNRYAYVRNNPVSATDPLGLWCVWEDLTHDDDPSMGGVSSLACQSLGGHWDDTDTITGMFMDGDGNLFALNADGTISNQTTESVVVNGGSSNDIATISAYYPPVSTCLGQSAIAVGEDLLGLSLLPGTDQNNWAWSSAKFGFVYTGAAEAESLSSISTGVDVVGKSSDFLADTPAAQATVRQALRSEGLKVSLKHVSKDAAAFGKYAGWAGRIISAASAYQRYQKCRGN
jgi:RHS repeat-associated protein